MFVQKFSRDILFLVNRFSVANLIAPFCVDERLLHFLNTPDIFFLNAFIDSSFRTVFNNNGRSVFDLFIDDAIVFVPFVAL